MASYNTNEFRSGLRIIIDGDPYIIVENEFVKPGKGTVVANMTVAEEQLEAIRAATVNGAKHFAEFDIDIVDEDGDVVATVHKTLYVREKPPKAQ